MKASKAAGYSGRALLIIFMVITFSITAIVVLMVVDREAEKTIAKLQSNSAQTEIQAAKNFMDQFFIATDMHISHLVEEPAIIGAVSGGAQINSHQHQAHNNTNHSHGSHGHQSGTDVFKHLHQFHLSNVEVKFCLFNSEGIVVFNTLPQEGPIEQRLQLLRLIKSSSTNETVYLLREQNDQKIIKFYKPIYVKDHLQGVVVGAFPFYNDSFFSKLNSNNSRWFSLTQPGSNWLETPPGDNWKVESIQLAKSNISLVFAINNNASNAQREELLSRLAIALIIALLISSIIVYLFGRRLIINPFQKLEQSRTQLAQQAELLMNKEREATRLANVVKHTRDAVLITDKQGRIEWVNQAFESMTGFRKDEILGIKPGTLLQGEASNEKAIEKLRKAVKEHQPTRVEILNFSRTKQPYWVDIEISPVFNSHGELDKFIAVERDITATKKLQRKLENAVVAADSANIAKTQFLATMSHEIRTPMNGVLGMVQVMLSEAKEQKQKENLSLILESGNHLISILNDILDLTKVEQNKIELESSPFNIEQIIAPLRSTYQAVCQEKGIVLNIECYIDSNTTFLGDRNRVRQVLYNLLNNAIKFTERGGVTVEITNNPTTPSLLRFSVQDSGIGIETSALERIFEPFVQADASTTREYGGTGLGLAIVKQLVEKMGGTIDATSELGQGTRFEFEIKLPVTDGEHIKLVGNKQHYPSAVRPHHILIVEDNRVNAIVACKLLGLEGHTTNTVTNGALALEALNEQHYDLVLMDNHMPVMDGVEACTRIREQFGSGLLIFGWTADVFADSKQAFIDAGADCVLHKPLKKEELCDAIMQFSDTQEHSRYKD